MNRRTLISSMAASGVITSTGGWTTAASATTGFGFDTVIELAREAAAAAHEPRRLDLGFPFADLSYDAYRAIRFRPERRLWRDEGRGFEMDLLPPGLFYEDRVEIALVRDAEARPIAFDPTLFHYHPDYFPSAEGEAPEDAPVDLAYSGFRLRSTLNQPDVMDEFLVFQGASYFRAVARDQLYGLSARGLALRTASPEGEEFPIFRSFWIYEPEAGATSVRIQALLDSPSVAGAYDFVVRPGAETVMEVRSVLFPRSELATPGIAPLTSMYYFGPKSRAAIDDFRNAVHDSSGLQMVTGGGERLWRPLDNPATLQFAAFADGDPQGFGLVQRERTFEEYQDSEARYERRPSAWIVPSEPWGEGSVVLIEIPTDNEFNDNIVAFWRPAEPLRPGEEYRFDYRVHWSAHPPDEAPLARVMATRSGSDVNAPDRRSFVIDFTLGPQSLEGLMPEVSASEGQVVSLALKALPHERAARVAITFDPGDAQLAELRLVLKDANGRPASETWLARWTPR